MEAPFFWRETALQLPGQQFPREYIIPEEFMAKEDLHQGEKISIDTVDEDDDTIHTLNLPPPPVEEDPSNESIQQGPLTFNSNPPLAATNNQAKLMHWHYRLGLLTFDKLKPLALNGKILKKLAHIKPPECAGCLFGAMTKISWCSKES